MPDIDFGQLAEALNDKMDRDANNIESPRLPVFLVAKQDPTSENNYFWYRKYSDGWVVQGGWRNNYGGTITFPIAMSLTNQYTAIVVHNGNSAKGEGFIHCYNKKSASMSYGLSYSTDGMAYISWLVCGYAA